MGKRVYCRWADDDCVGPSCQYAICIQGKLLSRGVCGEFVRRQTSEATGPEAIKVEDVKLRGKLHQRFKEDDLY